MYQTQLKSVNGGLAIGANGERLQFIGNYPVTAGDVVWTDGNVIFGHTPPRASASPFIPTVKSGIPVLLANRRGYFTPAGTWQDYDVAVEDWIVNNNIDLYGGAERSASYEKFIDAVATDEGDVYTVRWNDAYGWLIVANSIFSAFPSLVYKNNEAIAQINLTPYATELNNFYNDVVATVKEDSSLDYIGGRAGIAFALEIHSLSVDESGSVSYFVAGSMSGYVVATHKNQTQYIGITCADSFVYKVQDGNAEKLSYGTYGSNYSGKGTTRQWNNITTQAGDGSCELDKFGRVSFFDENANLLATTAIDGYCYIELQSFTYTYNSSGVRTDKCTYKKYTPDGQILEKTAGTEGVDGIAPKTKAHMVDNTAYVIYEWEKDMVCRGIPIRDGFYLQADDGQLKPFTFKPIIKKLSDDVYLFGTHGGKLYIKTASGISEVGDGLRNFRLEELKNIANSKIAKGVD